MSPDLTLASRATDSIRFAGIVGFEYKPWLIDALRY
jgi:hypothetical protein